MRKIAQQLSTQSKGGHLRLAPRTADGGFSSDPRWPAMAQLMRTRSFYQKPPRCKKPGLEQDQDQSQVEAPRLGLKSRSAGEVQALAQHVIDLASLSSSTAPVKSQPKGLAPAKNQEEKKEIDPKAAPREESKQPTESELEEEGEEEKKLRGELSQALAGLGLTSEEAKVRLERYGSNELEKETEVPVWKALLLQFKNPLIVLLMVSSLVSLSIGEYVNGVAILATVILNAGIAVYTEHSANASLAALSQLTASTCSVKRNGSLLTLANDQLVPGDLVLLKTGDLIPADLLLLEAQDLSVDEALLTGESTEVHKKAWNRKSLSITGDSSKTEIQPAQPESGQSEQTERTKQSEQTEPAGEIEKTDQGGKTGAKEVLMPKDRVFMGTHVTSGHGEGVVVATGMRAKVGEVAAMLHSAGASSTDKMGMTPLQQSLQRTGAILGVLALLVCGLVFMAGMLRGEKDPAFADQPLWLQMTMISVSLAVSGIPEGLPLVVTVCLALGTRRLAGINALVRSLPAVENLGTTRVICTDKTGTLTEGRMTVVRLWGLSLAEAGSVHKSRDNLYRSETEAETKAEAETVFMQSQPPLPQSSAPALEEEAEEAPRQISGSSPPNQGSGQKGQLRYKSRDLRGPIMAPIPKYEPAWKLNGQVGFETFLSNPVSSTSLASARPLRSLRSLPASGSSTVSASTSMSLFVGTLCNDAQWVGEKAMGNSSDAALLAAGGEAQATDQIRRNYPRVLEIPFNSSRKLMVTVHRSQSSGRYLLCIKGAPNYLLPHCEQALLSDGKVAELSTAAQTVIQRAVDRQAKEALRVLALAYCLEIPSWLLSKLESQASAKSAANAAAKAAAKAAEATVASTPVSQELEEADERLRQILELPLVFSGLVGLQDPERKGVKAAIQQAREADIRTVMITGDYLETAVAIARNIGLVPLGSAGSKRCIDCQWLRPAATGGEYLADRDFDELTWETSVFARANPADKLQIVRSLQRQGLICAMTGDGVNDAPALKQADIGVAMGSGTAVARGASKLVLMDDDFSTLVEAVKQGRSIYDNILKFVIYLFGTNLTQLVSILACVCAGMVSPLTPIQILFINLITDGVSSVSLSVEKTEKDVMKFPPRDTKAALLNGERTAMVIVHALVLSACALASLLLGLHWHVGVFTLSEIAQSCATPALAAACGHGVHAARTMVFLTVAFAEGARVFTVRQFRESLFSNFFSNSYLLILSLLTTAITLACWLTPGLNEVFELVPLDWASILVPFGGVLITILCDELFKLHLRSRARKAQALALETTRWRQVNASLEAITLELKQLRTHPPLQSLS